MLVPLGPRSTGYGCQVMGQQHVFPQCRANTRHLTSECTLHPRCPGLPSLPPPAFPQSHSPPPTLLPALTQSRLQASPGRRIQHLSVYRQGRLLFSWFSQTEPSLTSVFTCRSILSYLFSPLVKCVYFIFSLLFPSSYFLS